MTINKTQSGTSSVLSFTGRLDTTTAPKPESKLTTCFADAAELTLE